MTDIVPDLGFNDACQCFPRWKYPRPADTSSTTNTFQGFDEAPERIDNISDTALHTFRNHYRDDTITKDDIFDYIYGILHAPSYREEFANDLSKMIPRIPFAPDFRAFRESRTTPRRPPPQLRNLRTTPTSKSRTHHAVLTLGRKTRIFSTRHAGNAVRR